MTVRLRPAPQPGRAIGVIRADMLRAFQPGKALASDGGPSTWMRPPRVAWAHASYPACHLTNVSASAVMDMSS